MNNVNNHIFAVVGAAYIFEYDGFAWNEIIKLEPSMSDDIDQLFNW